MKTRRYDGSDLRRILSGMVTDKTVCARIASQWQEGGLFDAPHANLIGQWCINYLKDYGDTPNGQLVGLFEAWVTKTTADDKTIQAVEGFLRGMSDEYEEEEPPASDYVLDRAGIYFNKVRMKRIVEAVSGDLDRNHVDQAYGRLTALTRIELGKGALIKPAEEYDVWEQAFNQEQQRPLVTYPGRLNSFIGSAMVRDSLIAFMGPDKSGKSMWLLDLTYRAIRRRCRVAYFEVGDMSRDAVIRRLGQRVVRRPLYPSKCRIPVSVSENNEVRYRVETYSKVLGSGESYKAFRKVCRGNDLLRLSCYPTSSVGADGVSSNVKDWEREGWVPDLIVIDYADILAPPSGIRDTLDQIEMTWKHLHRLSQEMHCLVVTATQSSAEAYRTNQLLSRRHFSGRKTKLADVDGMIGLNVSSEDKSRGITKLNWIVRRNEYYNERRYEVAAGCERIACPVIKARE